MFKKLSNFVGKKLSFTTLPGSIGMCLDAFEVFSGFSKGSFLHESKNSKMTDFATFSCNNGPVNVFLTKMTKLKMFSKHKRDDTGIKCYVMFNLTENVSGQPRLPKNADNWPNVSNFVALQSL